MRTASAILLIDDDPDDRALARLVLEREMPEVAVEEITDALAFAQACGRRGFALVILERELRWADGLAVLSLLKEDWPEVPVILFTAYGNEEVTLRAMRLGASDYLVKKPANFLRLPLAVRSALDKGRSRPLSAGFAGAGGAGAAPLESLLDRAQVAVFSATPEGRLIDASPGFLLILGVDSLEDAARLDLRPLLSAAAGQEGSRPEGTGAREVRLRRADGRPIWVEVIGAAVRDAEGPRIAGLVEDVTARKQAEEEMAARSAQLRRSNEELLQFASVASHELQAPVRMMERYTRLLQEEYEGQLGTSGDEMIGIVVDAARRLSSLIDDLLALSRVDEPRTAAGDRQRRGAPGADPGEPPGRHRGERRRGHALPPAGDRGRPFADGSAFAKPHWERDQVPRRGGPPGARGRAAGAPRVDLFRARQRPRDRSRRGGVDLHHLQAPAPRGPGQRHRSRHLPQDRRAPRRAHLGGVRARPRLQLPLHPPRSRERVPRSC